MLNNLLKFGNSLMGKFLSWISSKLQRLSEIEKRINKFSKDHERVLTLVFGPIVIAAFLASLVILLVL